MGANVEAKPGPRPTLSIRHGIALAIGIVVGAGIFRTPALVAGASADELTFLLTWVAGGVLSIIGALCYAELASTYPSSGGDYHYIRRAFGSKVSFLYAWSRLSVIQTGSLALLAFLFGDYAVQVVPLGPYGSAIYAAGAVICLTVLNWVHVNKGMGGQLWLTLAEISGLLLIVALGLFYLPADTVQAPSPVSESSLGLIMVFVLLTYGGWSEVVYVTPELRDGRKRIVTILVASLVFVTVLYVLVNMAYLRVLGLEGVASSEAVAAEVMRMAFGPAGVFVISALVAVAALTSANATSITGARTTYAVGRSIPRLRWLGQWNDARGTPGNALLAQCAFVLLLIIAGTFARDGFEMAVEFTAPVFWLFFLLVGVSLFVLRVKDPHRERPFRVPLYPVLPIIFCLTSGYLLYSSIVYTGISALVGVAILIIGALLIPFLNIPPDEEFDQ